MAVGSSPPASDGFCVPLAFLILRSRTLTRNGRLRTAVRAVTYPYWSAKFFSTGVPLSIRRARLFFLEEGGVLDRRWIPAVDQHLFALFEEQSVMTDLLADLEPIAVLWWKERPDGSPYTRLGNQRVVHTESARPWLSRRMQNGDRRRGTGARR